MNGATLAARPKRGDVEAGKNDGFTEDAHPVLLRLVWSEVMSRMLLNGTPRSGRSIRPWERGRKDTVISYPGEVTTSRAVFDFDGLGAYDSDIFSDMMRTRCVGPLS